MQSSHGSLISRDDTFFGVCAALGEDLGFNPIYLRATLGVLLLWNPVMVLGIYAAAGVVVLLSRLIFPSPRVAAAPVVTQAVAQADEAEDMDPLPMAA